jgi:FkbM family methyltransferase
MHKHKIYYKEIQYLLSTASEKFDHALICGCNTATQIIQSVEKNNTQLHQNEQNVIFDIGANVGTTTIILAEYFKNSIIYAFEPHPDNFLCLQKNIEDYGLSSRVFAFNIALSRENGKMSMKKVLENGNSGCYHVRNNIKDVNHIDVEVQNLNNFIETHNITKIDLVKMDVEGAEYDILLSLKYFDIIKYFHLEYHEERMPKCVAEEFKTLNIIDTELGPNMAFKRWLYKKLNITYESRKTKFIYDI